MERILKLLEVYEFAELLEAMDLEETDVLLILDDLGYLDKINIPEPL